MNSKSRRQTQLKALKAIKPSLSSHPVVYVGDESLLPLMAASILDQPVIVEGSSRWAKRIAEISGSNVQWSETVSKASVVIAEPHFDSALLPWQNLKFWPKLRQLGCSKVLPRAASLWAMPVQFKHLWKIKATLDTCMGFKMLPFDQLMIVSCLQIF
jgi:hypothetical protein